MNENYLFTGNRLYKAFSQPNGQVMLIPYEERIKGVSRPNAQIIRIISWEDNSYFGCNGTRWICHITIPFEKGKAEVIRVIKKAVKEIILWLKTPKS